MRLLLALSLTFLSSGAFALNNSLSTDMSVAIGVSDKGDFRATQASRQTAVTFTCVPTWNATGRTADLRFITNNERYDVTDTDKALTKNVDAGSMDGCQMRIDNLLVDGGRISIQVVLDKDSRVSEVRYCNSQNQCSLDPSTLHF